MGNPTRMLGVLSATVVILLCCCGVDGLAVRTKSEQGDNATNYDLVLRLNDAVSVQHDDLVCTGVKLDPEEAYIVGITPHASKETAHHLMVYGCVLPESPNYTESWHCTERSDNRPNSVCSMHERQILFAWAIDAPSVTFPEGVGFRISGKTGINYLVVQLHYAKKFPAGMTDNSGVTLHITKNRPPKQAGYHVLGSSGYIPPHQPAFPMESACSYDFDFTMYPFGYRTHAHQLGLVTSGYRIRDNKWTEIGRMSPQLPETFYPISHPGMTIRRGDKLAARCTMNSMARKDITKIGEWNTDEMCNFYILYATDDQRLLRTTYCFDDAQHYRWTDDFPAGDIPESASSLEGIPQADYIEAKFAQKALHPE